MHNRCELVDPKSFDVNLGEATLLSLLPRELLPAIQFYWKRPVPRLLQNLGKNPFSRFPLRKDTHVACHPFGIALCPTTGNILVSDVSDHSVTVLDPQGNFLHSFGKPKLEAPLGLCIDIFHDNNVLVISGHDHKTIQTWSSIGCFIKQFQPTEAAHLMGVEVHPVTGNLLVSDVTWDHIREYTIDGVFVRKYGSGMVSPGETKVDCHGDLWVGCKGQVVVLSPEGTTLKTFQVDWEPDDEPDATLSLAVDFDGSLVVADWTKGLAFFDPSPDGGPVKMTRREIEAHHLIGLAINRDGQLLVVDSGEKFVLVFGEPNQPSNVSFE